MPESKYYLNKLLEKVDDKYKMSLCTEEEGMGKVSKKKSSSIHQPPFHHKHDDMDIRRESLQVTIFDNEEEKLISYKNQMSDFLSVLAICFPKNTNLE